MKKTHPSDGTFGSWLHTELQRKGYDLGLRGGGRTRFAADSGISPSTVGRLLRNEGATDTRVLAAIAETLGYPLGTVLVRAGILTEADLDAISERRDTTQPPSHLSRQPMNSALPTHKQGASTSPPSPHSATPTKASTAHSSRAPEEP